MTINQQLEQIITKLALKKIADELNHSGLTINDYDETSLQDLLTEIFYDVGRDIDEQLEQTVMQINMKDVKQYLLKKSLSPETKTTFQDLVDHV